jgi:SAM-dependent methyltransferase
MRHAGWMSDLASDPWLRSRLGALQPFAEDDPVLPPVGVLTDFLNTYRRPLRKWLLDETGLDVPDIEARTARDPYPLPADVNREGYAAGWHLAYWLWGLADYLKTLQAVAPYGCTGGRVYDFGGGTGRVFRHFALQDDAWDVYSSDFRLSSVEWNLRHMPTAVKTFANTSSPTLPLPDGGMDLITAFSVFTHIDRGETAWLMELRRILKPGGLAYLTIHDEHTWRASERLRSQAQEALGLSPDAPMPPGKTVAPWRADDPYNCNVFHGAEHIARVWGRFFEVLEVRPMWVNAQAAVVLRRAD